MWNRQELKERGKAAFKGNYWRSVGAALVLTIAGGASIGSTGSSVRANSQEISAQMESLTPEQAATVVAIVLGVVGFAMLMGTLLNIFLFNPLKVGAQRFFLVNGEEPANLGELGYAFRSNYIRIVGVCFLRDLYVALWSCLLLIPGIVKAYAYRMVPYILAENPDMSAKEAITLSRKMMYGHKWNTFLLDLSFIGWHILTACTAGLVGVFYTGPYVAATDAELYRALRNDL
jgi:uncharacterized membrane protein